MIYFDFKKKFLVNTDLNKELFENANFRCILASLASRKIGWDQNFDLTRSLALMCSDINLIKKV